MLRDRGHELQKDRQISKSVLIIRNEKINIGNSVQANEGEKAILTLAVGVGHVLTVFVEILSRKSPLTKSKRLAKVLNVCKGPDWLELRKRMTGS